MNAQSADSARRPLPFPPPFARAYGDDSFGMYADLHIGPAPQLIQRFRWIEPGFFWMGSPANEAERHSGEGPRHRVTISKGFWLADTVCTQALWRAVLDEAPSHFRGDDRPVENVSWEDVQRFLSALNERFEDLNASLPTEAEWEYACRAGTQTPFSFGGTISTEVVNHDGRNPYAGGKKGRYRAETVAVKELPANAWGLYQMHGNVWEWCVDGMRDYADTPEIDPVGPTESSASRAVRGGAWFLIAWFARSAYRFQSDPRLRGSYLGFRFCLRPIQTGADAPGTPRPSGPRRDTES